MRRRFTRQLRWIFLALIPVMTVGIVLMFAPGQGGLLGNRENEQARALIEGTAVMATVNGQPVTRAEVDRQFNQLINQVLPYYAQRGQDIGMGMLWQLRNDAFEQAVQELLLQQAAKERGLSVSKREAKEKAQTLMDKQLASVKQQHKDPAELETFFARIMSQEPGAKPRERVSERQFRKWVMDQYLKDEAQLRASLVREKLMMAVADSTTASEQELLESFDQATVRHLVIPLNPAGKPKRTDQQAKERAEELLAKAQAGADFTALAKAESDDPEAARTGGLMEQIGRGRMDKAWDTAVFALKPGEVSGTIKLPWGYEIVKLESRTRQLPADFGKNKAGLLKNFTDQKKSEVWQQFVAGLQAQAQVKVTDPEIIAYQALQKGDKDALAKLQAAKPIVQQTGGAAAAAVFYQIGSILASQQKWEQAADAFAEADSSLGSDEGTSLTAMRTDALLGMAHCYEQLGNIEDAVLYYSAASDASESPMLHAQLQETFTKLGKSELAKQEKAWLTTYEQQQKEQQEAMLAAQQKAAKDASKTAAPAATPKPKPTPPGK